MEENQSGALTEEQIPEGSLLTEQLDSDGVEYVLLNLQLCGSVSSLASQFRL